MRLYSYSRSTTSYRVRAALNLKGVAYETVPIDLVAGDQRAADYARLNPGKGVPTLVLEDGTALTQSLAIIDYLEATYPNPQLLPKAPVARAQVQAVAHTVALDIHPVNNLRVIQHLKSTQNATAEEATAWMVHWMRTGFEAVEAMISDDTPFSFGFTPDLADICLIAQLYNAHRWGVDLTPFPKTKRVEGACLAVPAIAAAHPDQQPDAKDPT